MPIHRKERAEEPPGSLDRQIDPFSLLFSPCSPLLCCPLQKLKERVRPDFSIHLTCFLRIIRPLCRTCKKERQKAIMISSKREKEIRTHAKAHPQNNGLFVHCFGWPYWR